MLSEEKQEGDICISIFRALLISCGVVMFCLKVCTMSHSWWTYGIVMCMFQLTQIVIFYTLIDYSIIIIT